MHSRHCGVKYLLAAVAEGFPCVDLVHTSTVLKGAIAHEAVRDGR